MALDFYPRSTKLNETGLTLSAKDQVALLEHLTVRMTAAVRARDARSAMYHYIDREYYAYLQLSTEDQDRQRRNVSGDGVRPVDAKLSLLFSQLDEVQTYLLNVLAPERAIYSAMAAKDNQAVAKALATRMNKDAEFFKHYVQLAIFVLDALKYNFAPLGTYWNNVSGAIVRNDMYNKPDITNEVIWSGNELIAHDPYNFVYDVAVTDPTDLARQGEFFAFIERRSPFYLRRMADSGSLFNVERFLAASDGLLADACTEQWFMAPPAIRAGIAAALAGANTDWVRVLTAGQQSTADDRLELRTITHMYAWLRPKRWKLGVANDYRLHYIVLGGQSHVLYIKELLNAHGLLPIAVAQPFVDHFCLQTPSAAERLVPQQTFASYEMNVHQRTERKKLHGGLTVFNKQLFPQLANKTTDMIAGCVAAEMGSTDTDLRRHLVQFNDVPDTTRAFDNIKAAMEMMQDILPSRILQQVAGLDRATQYQAASVVQGANRRNLKIAKIINIQAMNVTRHIQIANLSLLSQPIAILDPAGSVTKFDPAQVRSTDVQFDIDDGLKGIDRLALILHIKDVLNAVLQSQQASQQLDVVGIIDYFTSLLGDNTDFRQFKIATPLDQLPPEQRQLAFQLLQQYAAQQQQQGTAASNVVPLSASSAL